jgi:addiction module RelE/StbE family toxin
LGQGRLKFTVRFSPFAKEDKKDIKMYLSKFYQGTPRRFTVLLKKQIVNLKENPYMYPEYQENTDYRHMSVGNYVVFYKVGDAEKQIDIYRILRASWDLPKYL